MKPPRVAVIGGGWAGLSAAVHLSAAGVPVTLFESARQLGGRARRVAFGADCVDNGQHLLLGAYRDTLELLRTIGVDEDRALLRLPLSLPMFDLAGPRVSLDAAALPAPLHLGVGLLRASGLSLRERLAALRFGAWALRRAGRLEPDTSVGTLLRQHRQPSKLVHAVWGPLCLAALNTPLEQASAQVFLRVLYDAFAHRRRDSDLLLTASDLGALLPDPALHFIEAHGGQVRLGERVEALRIEHGQVIGVQARNAGTVDCEQVVIATGPAAAMRLLAPHPSLGETAHGLGKLRYQPLVTVYLRYPEPVRLPVPLIGILGGMGQWVFDRRINGQPGLIGVVMSGVGPHMDLDNTALGTRIAAELAQLFPEWPEPAAQLVIREKRGTFSCEPQAEPLRPDHVTHVRGCWLAGDYTATGYPGTLEGAVRSGVQCARTILHQNVALAN